ncbi:MAG: endonuclease/exonuclease/phosphatase family protein [bacterium]|nr:endonuclease/exonuclease/phosphatase family protein [bacterium]
MFPVRLSIVTYNLWHVMRWEERKEAVGQFLERFRPDILCVQELRRITRDFIDARMPDHRRVEDDLDGWTEESNIFWNQTLMEEVEHGAEDVGMIEPKRRLFWVRLWVKRLGRTFFVGTAHFTYQGHPHELETGQSPRQVQVDRTIAALGQLVKEGEPAFFMGDLNDPVLPTEHLHKAGWINCFSALGLLPPPTWPAYPTTTFPVGAPVGNQSIDWLMANKEARPLMACSPHFYWGDMAPSDHWPVQALYQIGGEPAGQCSGAKPTQRKAYGKRADFGMG